ncbi:endonuclease/exonuclease/phosphatase family protein [Gorillibacterium massiliense]|uniref:endonuclease/exonuclease/phosphatase family protein n=1 Tax=Gorillibacterium massiliense TaxID=1280390 RepID=UPI0004B55BC9|nr:endonuclease/exonuclease/phosphatase family protein [Gorillibacterium massiliense]
MKIRAMTFNIHHGQGMDGKTDIARIAREIESVDADIIALQEVDRFHPRSYFHDQLFRVTHKLGVHGAFASSIHLGLTRYGNAILSRHPFLSKRVTYLQGTQERRSILTVKLDLGDCPLTVVNTHIGVFAKEKDRQFKELRKELESLDEPALLMGDFNMLPSDPRLQNMPIGWRKIGLQEMTPTHATNGKEIDHIFRNMPVKMERTWVKFTTASDHHAVVADIEW